MYKTTFSLALLLFVNILSLTSAYAETFNVSTTPELREALKFAATNGAPDTCDEACIALGMTADTDDGNNDESDLCPLSTGLSSILNNEDVTPDILVLEYCNSTTSPKLIFRVVVSENIDTSLPMSLLFWLQDNDQTWVYLEYSAEHNAYILEYPLNSMASNGNYNIRMITFIDLSGNNITLNESQLIELGFNTTTILENTNADNLSPIVDALYSDGWSINSDNKPIIEFELQASDIGSGLKVDDVIIELLSPSGTSIQKRSNFNDGQSSFSISLSKFAASGDYRVNTIRLYDNAGNSTLGYDYINANDTIYTLDNPNSDNEGAILKSFELSAVFDESAQRPIIKIKGSARDDVSGLKNVYLRLERPGGGNLDKWITESASEPGLAVFGNQIPLTTQFISGEYIVNFLILTDIAGNEVTLNGNDVVSLNSTSSSSISVFFPSEIDIAEQNVIIEGTSKKDFVFGTDLTDDVLFSSGGNDYIYSGDGNDDVDAGPGDDIIVGGSGAGNDNYAGGEGVDKVIYSSAINSIYVDLYKNIAMGSDIDNDVLSGIENIQSGNGSDVLRGDDQSNSIWGGEGNDVFVGTKGADQLDGELGNDVYIYTHAEQSSTLDTDTLILDNGDIIKIPFLTDGPLTIAEYEADESLNASMAKVDINSDLSDSVYHQKMIKIINTEGQFILFNTSGSTLVDGLILQVNDLNLVKVERLSVSEWGDLGLTKYIPKLYPQINTDSDYDLVLNIIDADDDNDGIDDTADTYPLVAIGNLTDTDADGAPDVCDEGCVELGMVADSDDDNDGVVDTIDVFPLDSDKFTILDDDIAPLVTAPADIYTTATGVLTVVELGQAIVSDNLETLMAAADKNGPFTSGQTDIIWSAADSAGNTGNSIQSVFITPLVTAPSNVSVFIGEAVTATLSLSGEPVDYPVLIPVTARVEGVELSTNQLEILSGTFATLNISINETVEVDTLTVSLGEPVNAALSDAYEIVVKIESRIIAPYTLLEQPTPQFASLSPTAKIIVTGSAGENFFDVAKYISNATTDNPVSVVGETFLISGSSEIDGFMVQPGVKYDLTNLKGGIDKLYFSGPLAEYADSILLDSATGVMQLSRLTDVGEEVVQFIATASAADTLIFTDGALSTADVKAAVSAQTPLTDLTLDTSIKALDDKTITGATVKHIVLSSDGGSVMGLGPSIKTLISGNSGIDQIYVPAGSIVDASNLKSGRDEITVEGDLADYDISLDASGNIVLNREVDIDDVTHTESVTVANGGNVATNDLVIFADQQLDISTIKQQL